MLPICQEKFGHVGWYHSFSYDLPECKLIINTVQFYVFVIESPRLSRDCNISNSAPSGDVTTHRVPTQTLPSVSTVQAIVFDVCVSSFSVVRVIKQPSSSAAKRRLNFGGYGVRGG